MRRSAGDLLPSGKRFELIAKLGEGAAGAVYAALDGEDGRRVALKVLRAPDPEALLLLKSEFRSVAEIHHPNLVRLGELLEDDGRWFFTMELVVGTDALSYVRPSRPGDFLQGRMGAERDLPGRPLPPLDPARLQHVLVQMLQGLSALHAAGKVHCDVKPSNVLVTREGRAVILDFGVIRDARSARAAREGPLQGTVAYMAPEQVLGEPIGPGTDLYGVGTFLYLALAGRLPFAGDARAIMEAKLSRSPLPPTADDGALPPGLVELCLRMLSPEPAARPSVEQALACLGVAPGQSQPPPPSPTFVGRRDELARLRAVFDEVRAGAAVTVVLRGESGMGKTYLAQEFVDRCRQRVPGLRALQGKCYEQESAPYKALDGVVDELTSLLAERPADEVEALLPPDVALLRPIFPGIDRIGPVAALPFPSGLDANPHELRRRAVRALRELLARVAAEAPLLVLIDDMQWGNADSLQLLSDLLRPPHAPPLLLLVTQRPLPVGAPRAGEALPGDVRVLDLPSLTPQDSLELVQRLLTDVGHGRASESFITELAHETRGHPFFIHELVLQGASSSDEASPRLDEALWKRVCALQSEARAIVEIVCLAGLPLRQELLLDILPLSFARARELTAELRAGSLIRGSGLRRADVIEPYHDRVRESVVAHLTEARRRELHMLLAAALELEPGTPADVLATHWEGAGEAERALTATLEAAARAASALAWDYAAHLYRRTLARGIADHVLRRSVLERLGDVLRNGGRGAEAARAYEQAAELDTGTPARDLRRRAAEQLMTSGQLDEGRRAFRRVIEEEGIGLIWTPWAAVVAGLVRRLWLWLRGTRFRQRSESQVEPRVLREMDVLWDAMRGLCLVDVSLGFDIGVRLVLLALKAGEPKRLCRFVCVEAIAVTSGGDRRRGRQLVAMAGKLLEGTDDRHTHGVHGMAVALMDFWDNRWQPAAERAVDVAQHFTRFGGGVAWETAFAHCWALIALFRSGQVRRMRAVAQESYDEASRRGDLFAMTYCGVGFPTLLYLQCDDPEAGRVRVRELIARWTRDAYLYPHYHALFYEATADLYCQQPQRAFERITGEWSALRRSYLLLFPEVADELYHLRARAALGYAQGLPAGSGLRRRLLRGAAADARRLARRPVPWPRANAMQLSAALAHLRGDPARAVLRLTEAARLYEQESGMPLYAAACRMQLGTLLGGEQGERLRSEAERAFRAEEVARPDRFASMLATGLGPAVE